MTAKTSKESKQRIMDAAISLFAQKGFAAVGVREIASAAGVNIAMISYYFDGKVGILKAIMEEFFDRYSQIFGDVDDESKSPEKCLRLLIRNLINFVRENTDLAMVAYNELPLETPEIAKLKAERGSSLIKKISGLIRRFGLDPNDKFQIGIVGPSIIAMIFANFRFRPVFRHIYDFEFNDVYYEQLSETIATLFLNGVYGVAGVREKPARR